MVHLTSISCAKKLWEISPTFSCILETYYDDEHVEDMRNKAWYNEISAMLSNVVFSRFSVSLFA